MTQAAAKGGAAPDYTFENHLGAADGQIVIGLDEAGRGPWAGPVVAAAAWLDPDRLPTDLTGRLRDSKTMTASARATAFALMNEQAAEGPRTGLAFALGWASVAEIDRINILQASLTAMTRAVAELAVTPVAALVDGNRAPRLDCPVTTVVKGDARCLSIAAASIVAKVVRDQHMEELARRHPGYGWERNRGYGTAEHRAGLESLGVTPEHRRSFRPIRELLSLSC